MIYENQNHAETVLLSEVTKCYKAGGRWWEWQRENSLDCDCVDTFAVKFAQSNGIIRVAKCCKVCGAKKTEGVKKSDYNVDALPEYDESIQEAWRGIEAECRQWAQHYQDLDRKQETEERSREWWATYTAYLQTDKWKTKRNAVMKRDGNLCQACLYRAADHAHHLTYDRVFDEPLFDLVAVCKQCHEKLHGRKL